MKISILFFILLNLVSFNTFASKKSIEQQIDEAIEKNNLSFSVPYSIGTQLYLTSKECAITDIRNNRIFADCEKSSISTAVANEDEQSLEQELSAAILKYGEFSLNYSQEAHDILIKKNCQIEVIGNKMNAYCNNHIDSSSQGTKIKRKINNNGNSRVTSCFVC